MLGKLSNPMRLPDFKLSCDIRAICNADWFYACTVKQNHSSAWPGTDRLNYATYIHMLT
jgi:hypothetical protein